MAEKWRILWALSLLIIVVQGKYSKHGPRVCIIGAGVAGILSSNKLSGSPKEFEIIAFDKNADVGGQWIYTDRTDYDEHGLPVSSNVYKYMRANGPKPLQMFPDYKEFHGENRSYVRHDTMLQYLRNYTEHFGLRRFMRFNTWVKTVKSIRNDKWHLELRDLNTNKEYDMNCDAVIVGTGNFHEPNIPKIKGIERFPGLVMHNRTYRVPQIFTNQKVVVLGASYSGMDIALQISEYAKKVYISQSEGANVPTMLFYDHYKLFKYRRMNVDLPANTMEVPGVKEADGDEFILSDGSRIKADAILMATGYLYNYPILDKYIGISVVEGKYVRPLYKHLINAKHPTMSIIGLPHPGFPFLVPYAQAEYVVAVLEGKVKLPSCKEMLKDSELPEGVPPSKAHYMLPNQTLPYYDELALAAGSKAMPDGIKNSFVVYYDDALHNPMYFKERDLYVYDNDTFEFVDRY